MILYAKYTKAEIRNCSLLYLSFNASNSTAFIKSAFLLALQFKYDEVSNLGNKVIRNKYHHPILSQVTSGRINFLNLHFDLDSELGQEFGMFHKIIYHSNFTHCAYTVCATFAEFIQFM